MNNCSLAEKFLTFTFSADFIISQKSIDDFPKIYSFSFFASSVEQIRERSASTTFKKAIRLSREILMFLAVI